MRNNRFRIVFIGDVAGKPGRRLLAKVLPMIKIKYSPDLVIANGENSAGGLGIIPKTADELYQGGVNIITTGNHVWDKKEAIELLKEDLRVVRPINYPNAAPGNGSTVFKGPDGVDVLIVNLQGRVFMEPVVENPFLAMDALLEKVGRKYDIIFVDFHAEATAEKQAMGFYLDGRVSAVLCTHTHVQTADLRILPGGTAYQSDVGMTGSLDSVIGMKMEPVISKFTTGVNKRFEVARNNLILDMTFLEIDRHSSQTLNAESARLYEDTYEKQLGF